MTKAHRDWEADYRGVVQDFQSLENRIVELGVAGDLLVLLEERRPTPQWLAVLAGNSIEGTLSLLRELWRRVNDRNDGNTQPAVDDTKGTS
jgi:hypothetical protein